jgi:hypothetical protein
VRRALRKLSRIGLIEGQRAGWRDGRARYWLAMGREGNQAS